MNAACCKAGPPIKSDYQPKGTIKKIGDFDCYITGADSPNAILLTYDIFGFSPQAKQVCDRLADAGFVVAMPDYFRGEPWLLEKFPPKEEDHFMDWVGKFPFDSHVKPDMEATIAYLKENHGAQAFGTLGHCWGGGQVTKAACTDLFKAVAMAHPAFVDAEAVQPVKVPLCILPSGDEPDFAPVQEVLSKKPFADKCIIQRFDSMHHGWLAARGDWSVPEQAKCASEGLAIITEFFQKNVKA